MPDEAAARVQSGMRTPIPRRLALKQLSAAAAGLACSGGIIRGQSRPIVVNGTPVEIAVSSVSAMTVRLTVSPIAGTPVPDDNALVAAAAGKAAARRRDPTAFSPVRAGDLTVRFTM